MLEDMYNTSSLYVWGSNESSELGLPEEFITNNIKVTNSGVEKTKITKP
jgi:alpha-tubulin suppressor-like RCC1 family protein